MTSTRSVFLSTGAYLPQKILRNADLEKMVDTSDEWIIQRTGIRQRHIAEPGETTADMALAAARSALQRADISPASIDGVIVATTTPDTTFPAVAVKVQAALGIPVCPAFDVQAVCTGFLYALSLADAMLRTGQCRRMLVIGAEKMSSIVDWTDRTTCVLFADGAGAVVLEAQDQAGAGVSARGLLGCKLYADGRHAGLLKTTGGVSSTGTSGHVHMQGREVFKHAVTFMAEAAEAMLSAHNLKGTDLDWLVPHQANMRILEATAQKLGLPMDKLILTLERHGNTSAASVPLALHEGVSDGRIRPGHLLLFEAMGGGLTWGAALARF